MEKSFIGQEDQMSKLRTEVGANLNSLNYDISGLLQFKNESGKSKTGVRVKESKHFFTEDVAPRWASNHGPLHVNYRDK